MHINSASYWTYYYVGVVVFIMLFDAGVRYAMPEHAEIAEGIRLTNRHGIVQTVDNINRFFFVPKEAQIKIPGISPNTVKWYCSYCSHEKTAVDLLSSVSADCENTPDQVPSSIDFSGTLHLDFGLSQAGGNCIFLWK